MIGYTIIVDIFFVAVSTDILSIQQIADKFSLDLIILFGSQATGKTHSESDWDIAVKGYHVLTMDQRIDLIGEFEKHFPNVDIVDIRRADPLLLACIASDGKPLYERDPLNFAEFKLYAQTQYIDARPLLDKVIEKNKAFIASLKDEQ